MFGNEKEQQDSSKTIKLILAIGLATAAVLASAGVFYYYVVFVPNLEQQKFDLEKQMLKEKQDTEAQALEKKEQQAEKRTQAYQICLSEAEQSYSNHWSNSCSSLADRNKVKLQNCLNDNSILNNQFMGEKWCHENFGKTEFDPQCTLPRGVADDIERNRKDNKERCLSEAQNALL